MKKIIILAIFVIVILIVLPVNAGWSSFFDSLFGKSVAKETLTGRRIAKNTFKEEKISASVVKDIKQDQKIADEVKVTNREFSKFEEGLTWEKQVEKSLCAEFKCYYSADYLGYVIWDKSEEFIIVGGAESNKFINKYGLYDYYQDASWGKFYTQDHFTKQPDFLKVTRQGNNIKKIEIIDAKLSPDAVRLEQEKGFKELCSRAINSHSVDCEIQYAVKKQNVPRADISGICLTTLVLPFNPLDIICFLAG